MDREVRGSPAVVVMGVGMTVVAATEEVATEEVVMEAAARVAAERAEVGRTVVTAAVVTAVVTAAAAMVVARVVERAVEAMAEGSEAAAPVMVMVEAAMGEGSGVEVRAAARVETVRVILEWRAAPRAATRPVRGHAAPGRRAAATPR